MSTEAIVGIVGGLISAGILTVAIMAYVNAKAARREAQAARDQAATAQETATEALNSIASAIDSASVADRKDQTMREALDMASQLLAATRHSTSKNRATVSLISNEIARNAGAKWRPDLTDEFREHLAAVVREANEWLPLATNAKFIPDSIHTNIRDHVAAMGQIATRSRPTLNGPERAVRRK